VQRVAAASGVRPYTANSISRYVGSCQQLPAAVAHRALQRIGRLPHRSHEAKRQEWREYITQVSAWELEEYLAKF
jgi:ubiquinone biosynthesis protein UbiJ